MEAVVVEEVEAVVVEEVEVVHLQTVVRALYEDRGYATDLDVLVRGLAEEAGEVCAASLDMDPRFRAKPDSTSSHLRHELGDVLVYLAAVANSAGIDLQLWIDEAAWQRMCTVHPPKADKRRG